MRTVISKNEFLTIGELRRFLNSAEAMALNENAFIWIPKPEDNEDWAIDCAIGVEIEKVCTPEDDHPEETGICFYSKKMRNKRTEYEKQSENTPREHGTDSIP